MNETKPKRILRRPQVQDRVGLTHSQIDSMERRGLFPKRIKISVKAAGWPCRALPDREAPAALNLNKKISMRNACRRAHR
jgi:predicted DNA-binding transcriptional regulator AlpA